MMTSCVSDLTLDSLKLIQRSAPVINSCSLNGICQDVSLPSQKNHNYLCNCQSKSFTKMQRIHTINLIKHTFTILDCHIIFLKILVPRTKDVSFNCDGRTLILSH